MSRWSLFPHLHLSLDVFSFASHLIFPLMHILLYPSSLVLILPCPLLSLMQLSLHELLLLEAFSSVNEPDCIYGVAKSNKVP